MKKNLNTLAALTALAILAAPLTAGAHCGSCGSDETHSHDEASSETKAIFPLAEDAGFTTLVAVIKAAGLEETLTIEGPFTVFAPTDEAFANLPEGTVEALLADPVKLKKVLLYHVVSGSVTSAQIVELTEAMTLEGTDVTIGTEDGVEINNAKVVQADIEATNGTVHVIDTVLIPGNL